MKIKTSELIGAQLDWAACLAKGNKPVINPVRFGSVSYGKFESELGYAIKHYSSDWSVAGPIIEREKIEIYWSVYFQHWHGSYTGELCSYGASPLIAAMRCYIASKLGDEVDIPDELS